MASPALRVCLIDMNNGVANQATRCFRRLVDGFKARVRAANPGADVAFQHVQPRNLGELPDRQVDLVLSSGGPGSPFDGYDDPWCTGYRHFLDWLHEAQHRDALRAPAALLVCHSFELATLHFKVAQMILRPQGRKFGVMPAYVTSKGRESVLFEPFGDRLFVFENRDWEAVHLDAKRLFALGGRLLARESRPGRSDKGSSVLAYDLGPGIASVQFHPEADLPGVLNWVKRPDNIAAVRKTYGEQLYQRMIKTLNDPTRLARTFALFVPGWLTRRFNELAPLRGLKPIGPPVLDMKEFIADSSAANGVAAANG